MDNIVLLGTGSAVPTKSRNHPSIYLNLSGSKVLLDCGEGTQRQIRLAGLSPSIDYIFLTHWHGDHSLGVGGVIQSLNMSKSNKPLYIFGPEGTEKSVKNILSTYKFYNNMNIVTREIDQPREKKVVSIGNHDIYSMNVRHSVPCVGYKIKEKDSININKDFLKSHGIKPSEELRKLKEGKDIIYNGKKIKASDATYIKKGMTLAYLTDLIYEEKLVKFVQGVDVLITECTFSFTKQKEAKVSFHLTTEDAIKLASKAKVKSLVLMHQSQRYEGTDIIDKEVKDLCKKYKCKFNTIMGKDLDRINLW